MAERDSARSHPKRRLMFLRSTEESWLRSEVPRPRDFLKALATKLVDQGFRETMPYVLGRFRTVRTGYSVIRSLQDRDGIVPLQPSIFPPLDINAAVKSIRARGIFDEFLLPIEAVNELRTLASRNLLKHRWGEREFHYRDVIGGKLPDNSPAILADVTGAVDDPTVRRISEDPQVLAIVKSYLGYRPKKRDIYYMCSFVCNGLPDERRRRGQTIDFHYDVHSYNFVYANYYVLPVDDTAGPHVMIEGSHNRKPLRWLLGSARQTESVLRHHYTEEKFLTLTGPAGFAFIQDPSCYHKATVPLKKERLLLQVRYS
jgi:hypothetical protein